MNDALSSFQVTDKKSFIEFVELMLEDLEENPETWETKTLPEFLTSLCTNTEDIQDHYDSMRLKVDASKPTWQLFADILKAATLYE